MLQTKNWNLYECDILTKKRARNWKILFLNVATEEELERHKNIIYWGCIYGAMSRENQWKIEQNWDKGEELHTSRKKGRQQKFF